MPIHELKSKYIWVVLIIGMLIPAIRPLGVPFPMNNVTVEIYELVENLPEGSIVIMGGSGVFAFDLESSPGMIAAIKQMAAHGVRLVTCPTGSEVPQFHKFLIDAARVDKKFGGPWEYGVDYVMLPYLPGGAMIVYDQFLTDVHKTVSIDLAGTPIDQLPLMNELRDYKDVVAWFCPHWGFVDVVRIVTGQYGITAISFAQSTAYAFFSPFMQTYPGQVYMTNGYLGGDQYEKLNNMKGLGHKVQDSYSVISVLIAAFIVLGNVTLFSKQEEEE